MFFSLNTQCYGLTIALYKLIRTVYQVSDVAHRTLVICMLVYYENKHANQNSNQFHVNPL